MSDPQERGNELPMAQKTILDEAIYGRPAPARTNERTELIGDDAPPTVMAWLVFLGEGPRRGHMIRLLGGAVMIGRAEDCEILIDDRAVSRQHAKIRIEGSGDATRYIIHDMATDNGTFVNGSRNLPIELQNGDMIRIGRTELMFKRI